MIKNKIKSKRHSELVSESNQCGSRNKFKMRGKSGYIITGILMIVLMGTMFQANAYTSCVGGTPVSRNQYGTSGVPSTCTATTCPGDAKTFCKSIKTMNWWSAFNWCKSNGGTLASFASMCPGVPAIHNNVEGACPALQGLGGSWVWTGLGRGSSDAFIVNLTSGAVFGTEARFRDYRFAFCE